MTSMNIPRSAIVALHSGLALALVATLVPYIDRAAANLLADHIQAGYPSYGQSRIDTAVTTYLIYLTVLGAVGIVSWLVVIRAASAGKRWARWAAAGLFAVGTCIAVFNMTVQDTSGDTGLPPALGWVGLLPCLAGLLAVILMWRPRVGLAAKAAQ